MNLFQLATRGVDLSKLPDEEAPRQSVAFEPSTNGGKFSVPTDLNDAFEFAAKDFGIDPDVLRAVAYAESRFHTDVVSGKVKSKTGATGLMQFMPKTAQEYGIDPLDPVQSIFGAAAYLRKSLDKFDGDYERAVASYNWGPNRKAFGSDDWVDKAPEETRKYLGTVFTAADQLKSGKAERPLPAGVEPSKAGAGRGAVNPGMVNTQETQAVEPPAPKAAPSTDRTWGEVASDTTKSVAQGLLDVASLPGAAYSAATGNWNTDYMNAIRGTQEVLQEQKSPGIQAQQKALQKKLETAEGWREKFAVGGIETITNPALLADTLARSAPGMLAGGLAGRAAGAGANALGNAAIGRTIATGSEAAARVALVAKNGAGAIARGVATGTAASQQGVSVANEVYGELSKLPPEAFSSEPEYAELAKQFGPEQAKEVLASAAANRALLMATGASVLSMKLVPSGSAIETMFLPKTLKGEAAKAVASTSMLTKPIGQGMTGGVVSKTVEMMVQGAKTGGAESFSEGFEEATGAGAKGLELSRAGKDVNLGEMMGEAGGQGAAAGLVIGKIAGMQEAYQAPRVESQPTTPTAPQVTPSNGVYPKPVNGVYPNSTATQAVDNIAALLKQTEANIDGTATQATPVQPGSQAADVGAAQVDAAQQSATEGQTGTGAVDVAGQSDSAQSLTQPVDGFVRLYHGGSVDGETARWVTPDLKYAQGYANKSRGAVFYVDVPANSPYLTKAFDDTGTSVKAQINAFNAPPEIASQLKPMPQQAGATGIAAEMAAMKERNQPAASQQAQPQIFTGKSALFGGYGASVGSVEAGDRKQLMVDPNGGYFWGDWKQESQRDVGAVAGGADKDATPASFTSSKEARQAAASTPLHAAQTTPSQPAQQQQAKPRAKPQPLLNDTEAAMLADFERMYQADVKGEIKTRMGLIPARQDEATAPADKRKPSELLAAIRRAGGIKSTNAADLMGGSAMDANRILPGLFKKDGMNLDLLVPFLKDRGYLTQADEDSIKDNGGVNKLAEILQAALSGDRAQTVDSTAGFESDAEAAMRSELDSKAFALGLPMKVTNEMSTERLNGVINRIERKLGKPVNTDFATRKMSRTEAMAERQAILMADRVERARAQYDADIQAFAEANDRVQERVLDVMTDEDGNIEVIYESTAGEAYDEGRDSREDSGEVGRPVAQGARAGASNPEADRTEAGAGQEGLTSYTSAEVTARQDSAAQAEATAKRAEEAAARAEAAAKQASEIAQRSVAAADTFELGGNAEDNLSGQEGLRFSSANQPTNGITTEAAQKIVDGITAQWKNAPEVVVLADLQDVKAPKAVRDYDAQQRSQGAEGEPEGFWYKGKAYVVAGALNKPDDVARVLMHEALGHYGLRGVFGDDLKPILRQVAMMRQKDVAAKAEQYGLDVNDEAGRLHAAEEVLAEMAQSNPDAGVVKRAIAAIRAWMRKHIPGFRNMALTDADIISNYLLPARNFVVNGGRDGGQGGGVRFQRSESAVQRAKYTADTITVDGKERPTTISNGKPISDAEQGLVNFWRWFGDSEVVDAAGKPLVVMHGTPNDQFFEFDPDRVGDNNYGSSGSGFWFTDDYSQARRYWDPRGRNPAKPNIMEVYLKAVNPLVADPAAEAEAIALDQGIDDFDSSDWDQVSELLQYAEWAQDKVKEAMRNGHDSLLIKQSGDAPGNTGSGDHWVVFDPTQIKSATGNNGQFDLANPDIRFSRGPSPAWMLPKSTKADALVYELQDQKVDLKRTQDAIAEAGRTITEPFDARMAETLMPGRVAYRTETFLKTEVAPLMEAMAKNNVTQNELSDYLLARHAPERNAQIAKVNPEMPDGGAGTNSQGVLMTTQAAQDHIAALTTGKRMVLQLLANKIDAITASTRDLLVREGLEKQSTMDAWTGAYKHYVPLFKDEAVESPAHPIGSGMSVTGSASKRAMGSEGEVTNMVAHILMQREAAITRAEKNRVAMSLYGLALSNPNQEVWTTIRPNMSADKIGSELAAMGVDPVEAEQGMQGVPTIRTVNAVTGLVQETPNPMYKRLENALVVKVDGEDRVVLFNAKNADAMRMARALKNQDGLTNFDLAGSMVGTATRYFASINTQYNPAFGMVNVVRDIGGALVNLTTTGIADKKANVLGDIPAAMKGIARDVRGDQARTPWSDLWVQFQEDGGRTGYRDLFIDPFKRAEAVQKDLDAMQRDGTASAGRVAHSILDLLDDFNTTLENGVRLSAYKAALDKGMSRPAAAKMARELTVDFNRKGRTGREVGPLYAFFNASVQGTARTIESLKGPAGKKIIAGGLMLGVIQSLMLAAAGFDDDEPPEFVKARSFIIPMGDKKYIAIPLQFGLSALPNTGRVITDLLLTGGKDAGKKTFNAIGEIMGSFNPLGGGNIFTAHGLLTTVAPTVADPLVDLATNTNFAGTPIGKDRADWDTRPGAKLARESTQRSLTGQAYIGISKAINAASGGNEFKKGLASPTPEQVQYVFTTAGGGLYRELEKTLNIAGLKADGMEVKSRMIPLGGRFAGEADDQDTQRSRYYRNSERLAALEAELKGFEKDDNEAAVRRIETERSDEVDLLGDYKHIRQAIAKLNKLAADNINDMEMLKELDAERLELMRELNDSVRKLEKRSELFKRD